MADLKKLDEIVDQLGVESKRLKGFNEIYSEIEKLKAELESNMKAFDSISDKFDEASKALQDKTKSLSVKLTEIQSAIMERVDSIEESNKKFQRDFDSEITSKLSKYKSDIEVTIRSEGNETAKQIESSLNTTFLKTLNALNNKTQYLLLMGVLLIATNIYLIQS